MYLVNNIDYRYINFSMYLKSDFLLIIVTGGSTFISTTNVISLGDVGLNPTPQLRTWRCATTATIKADEMAQ
jgi:hypothetical protein